MTISGCPAFVGHHCHRDLPAVVDSARDGESRRVGVAQRAVGDAYGVVVAAVALALARHD